MRFLLFVASAYTIGVRYPALLGGAIIAGVLLGIFAHRMTTPRMYHRDHDE